MCFMPIMCALCLQYVKTNKEADNDWFRLESNKEGTKCVCVCLSACVSVCLSVCLSVSLFVGPYSFVLAVEMLVIDSW